MAYDSFSMRDLNMRKYDTECITEIRRQLNRFRHDQGFRGMGRRVPWRQFAKLCGVSRQTLYDLCRGDRKGIDPGTRDRIFTALKLVEQGLRWKRVVMKKAKREITVRVIEPGVIEWQPIMPNGQPPPPIPQRPVSEAQLAMYAASAARERERAKARKQKNEKREKNDHQKLLMP